MLAVAKLAGLALVAIMPGGLLLITGWVLGRSLVRVWKAQPTGPGRVVRAFRGLRVSDVWNEVRIAAHLVSRTAAG